MASIRVGRRKYISGKPLDPKQDDYKNILTLTASTPYGDISPYVLKNEAGYILENVWQFSKAYEKVPRSKQFYSRFNKTVIWDYPKEVHAVKDNNGNFQPTPEYWIWREKGLRNKYAVRYPVGYHHRKNCIGSVLLNDETCEYEIIDYITARKKIYVPEYTQAVRKTKKYKKLLEMLKKGTSLLIVEVDGPHFESLNYYKKKYGVDDDFIDENNTLLMTPKNNSIMLNDSKHSYGHGYCLGMALYEDYHHSS